MTNYPESRSANKELEQQQLAPLYIILGPHNNSGVKYLEYESKAIRDYLEQSPDNESKLYYFTEDWEGTETRSNLISRLTDEGDDYSTIMYKIAYFGKNNILPGTIAPDKMTQFLNSQEPFIRSRIVMFDQLQKRFPGKIAFANEAHSNQKVKKLKSIKHAGLVAARIAQPELHRGKFYTALSAFKQELKSTYELIVLRDPDIAEQLGQLSAASGVTKVIARLGTLHTLPSKILLDGNYPVTSVITKDGIRQEYLFDPHDQIINKLLENPRSPVSELEWLQAMIGHEIYRQLTTKNEISSHPNSEQRLVARVFEILEPLNSSQVIKAFEQDVRKGKASESIQNFMSPLGICTYNDLFGNLT